MGRLAWAQAGWVWGLRQLPEPGSLGGLQGRGRERLSVLRTKAMREREEQRELRKYTYTLLRVRLPDGCLLQGGPPGFLVMLGLQLLQGQP